MSFGKSSKGQEKQRDYSYKEENAVEENDRLPKPIAWGYSGSMGRKKKPPQIKADSYINGERLRMD